MSKSKVRGKDSKRNHGKFHPIVAEGNWLAQTISKDLEDPSETRLGLGTVFQKNHQKAVMCVALRAFRLENRWEASLASSLWKIPMHDP